MCVCMCVWVGEGAMKRSTATRMPQLAPFNVERTRLLRTIPAQTPLKLYAQAEGHSVNELISARFGATPYRATPYPARRP